MPRFAGVPRRLSPVRLSRPQTGSRSTLSPGRSAGHGQGMTNAAEREPSDRPEGEAGIIRRALEASNQRDLLPVRPGAIVLGDDGSDLAHRPLEFTLELAERLAAPVIVLQAWTIETSLGELTDHHGYIRSFAEVTEAIRARLEARRTPTIGQHPAVSVEFRAVLAPPAEALVGLSGGAFLLVLGSRGLGALGSLVLGSVAVQCLRRSHCPVLVVPHHPSGSGG